jgi:hypothetical protein
MGLRIALTALVLLAGAATSAHAQSVSLEFNAGLVTLRAQNAPVRTILAEWARLGGATVLNGDRVAGAPLTLELTGVPERQALDIILRSVAGYMLAPRPAGSVGVSAFDRILILPTSTAPRAPAAPPPAVGRAVLPQPQLIRPPAEADDDIPEDDPGSDAPPPQPRGIPTPRPGLPPQPIIGPEPQIIEDDGQAEAPPSPGTVTPTPANPFGVPAGSSARPGVIAPVPQPQQGQRPTGRQQP